jgi:integrase/recombinase XerD
VAGPGAGPVASVGPLLFQQAKAFLAAIGGPGAVSGLDAAKVTAFMVDHSRDRNTWSAKAMVTSLRAFLRFAHATGRTAIPLAGAVPAVASRRRPKH